MAGGGQNPMTPDGAGGSTMKMPEPSYGGNPAPSMAPPTPPANPTPAVMPPRPQPQPWNPPAGGYQPPARPERPMMPGFGGFGGFEGFNPFAGFGGGAGGTPSWSAQDGVFQYNPNGGRGPFGGMFGGQMPDFDAIRQRMMDYAQQMQNRPRPSPSAGAPRSFEDVANRVRRPMGLGAINPYTREPE